MNDRAAYRPVQYFYPNVIPVYRRRQTINGSKGDLLRAHTRARAHTHTHTHTRARAHTHTHTHATVLFWALKTPNDSAVLINFTQSKGLFLSELSAPIYETTEHTGRLYLNRYIVPRKRRAEVLPVYSNTAQF